jgi:hypothetical protein
MSAEQYLFIVQKLIASKGSFLVFGAGNDSELWLSCCPGRNVIFVENDSNWIPKIPCNHFRPKYRGKVGQWLEKTRVPASLKRDWDFVLIDGPTGFSSECIGRQEPIAWSAKIGKTLFVHDYDRPWERKLCDYYLGTPDEILPFLRNQKERVLAVFYRQSNFRSARS